MTSDDTVSVDGEIINNTETNKDYLNENNNNREEGSCNKNNQCDCDQNFPTNGENICDSITLGNDKETVNIIKEILSNIFDDVANQSCNIKENGKTNQKASVYDAIQNDEENTLENRKLLNRKTKIFIDSSELYENELNLNENKRESLYSLEEHDEEPDEPEVVLRKPKAKTTQAVNHKLVNRHKSEIPIRDKSSNTKSSSSSSIFGSVFRRKAKKDVGGAGVEYISESKNKKQSHEVSAKKYPNRSFDNSSAVNINESKSGTNLSRTPSLRKKLTNFLNKDAPNLLKRSFSFKDLSKRREKEKSREKLSEMKNLEWASSLQSLVETDFGISYKDLSFINYDVQNEISYRKRKVQKTTPIRILQRAQSLHENGSTPINRKTNLLRGTSFPRHYQSTTDLSDSGALSLPSLHHLHQENVEIPSESLNRSQKYRRRPPSICSEDGSKSRPIGNGSFKSAGSGCAKLKRHNACRQKTRDINSIHGDTRSQEGETILFGIGKNSKIARESLNAEDRISPSPEGQQYEWRKLVGSIRRRVQRHASTSCTAETTSGGGATPTGQVRKNSLTRNKFDVFKWDKNKEESSNSPVLEKGKKERKSSLDKYETKKEIQKFLPLTKQKSVGPETANSDNFKALSFKDKQKSSSVKNIDCLISPKLCKRSFILNKGVRKSDQSSEKMQKNSSFRSNAEQEKKGISRIFQKLKEDKNVSRDDFLKATMRIFLVVSPPVGKIQVRSKSLNHLDEIEMRQSAEPPTDSGLKDSKSEPDCARTLLAPPVRAIPTPEPSITSTVDPTIEPPARKHVLTRSQKSSSECFSVNFEVGDENTWDNELFFPAVRGITLNDSLSKLCELRNIDLTSCDAWLQDKSSNTNAWLPFTQDTACLVGKHVRITAKDVSSNKKLSGSSLGSHSRKPSTSNSKSRTGSFFSSSIEDGTVSLTPNISQDNRLSLQDSDASKKQPKQRWSGFFTNAKDTKMELLVEQLNSYAKSGIPNNQIYPQGQCESIDALYKLEGDWREIIDCSDLTEKLQQQQTALWELIKTEVAYIKTLKVVTDLFLACLKNLQSVNLLKEIDTEKLFSNITEILDANVLFWRNCIFPLVRDMRRYKQPPCIENMLQGFLKMGDTFQAYFRYCAEQARCQHYCRENHTHNELFTAYLAWCETQKECNRLRLMDILVQPMQRLTKYGLLLKAILRNTDDDVEKDNLNLMVKSVDDFVNSVNFSLKQKQDNERLKGIMARIESYDVVESKDDDLEKLLKSYSQLDLNKPMVGCPPERKRHLLLEGDLKLKDSSTSKMEVHCFLLTDMLLVCKPSTKKGGATMRIVRQPYLVDRLVITELSRETPSLAVIYKNEFDLPVAAFILQNNDSKKLKGWKESITKAQLLYQQAKQINCPVEESLESDYPTEYTLEGDYHSLQLMPRSPLASSSRASRVSSLAHSHSGSVEMNDQSSIGSANQSRAVSMENENRTASISSDEGVQPLPPDKSPVSQKLSFKHRLFNKTPNTLSVQPYGSLGQSLPNLTLGSPNVGTLSLNLSQNTLSVPNSKTGTHLLSPTHRGVSYPPPSPTRGNLKRGLAISQNKNPPLLKTRHVTSTVGPITTGQPPTSFDFDVPVIAGVSSTDDSCENFSRGQHRQAMLKRIRNDNKRYHTAGVVDDIKHNDNKDPSIQKRLSWNCSPQASEVEPEDPT